MSSPDFVCRILPPPGSSIAKYERARPPDKQPAPVPRLFLDAMQVREEVFVREQGVPLENELDEDDARSWHWVLYASATKAFDLHNDSSTVKEDGAGSLAVKTDESVPVGTIRLVPPPHQAPHTQHTAAEPQPPLPAKRVGADENASRSGFSHSASLPLGGYSSAEPYVKPTRLAVLAPYRRLGLARLLLSTALSYASSHPAKLVSGSLPVEKPGVGETGLGDDAVKTEPSASWRGLVRVHAQEKAVGWWQREGFLLDMKMDGEEEGEVADGWDEEGIWHLGMWKRITVEG